VTKRVISTGTDIDGIKALRKIGGRHYLQRYAFCIAFEAAPEYNRYVVKLTPACVRSSCDLFIMRFKLL